MFLKSRSNEPFKFDKNTGWFRFARRRVSARGEYRVARRQPRAGTSRGYERDLRKPETTEAELCSGGLARKGKIRIVLMARMEARHYVGSANRFRSQECRFHGTERIKYDVPICDFLDSS